MIIVITKEYECEDKLMGYWSGRSLGRIGAGSGCGSCGFWLYL